MSQILRLYVHDLRRVLREPRSFRLLVLALALTSAATILAWPNETHHTRISSVQTVAVFAFTELVLLLLLAPLLASSIFTAERARNTSVLLETSLLSPGEFALSRLASIATTLTIAFSATAPIFAALHLLGGVAIEQILRMVAILLAAGISSAAIAVRAAFNTPAKSSLFGRVLLAVLGWQFGVPLLVWLGLLIPGVVINELGSAFGPSFVLDQSYRILLGFNSFAALGLTLDQPGVAATFGYLAFATFIVMGTARKLARRTRWEPPPDPVVQAAAMAPAEPPASLRGDPSDDAERNDDSKEDDDAQNAVEALATTPASEVADTGSSTIALAPRPPRRPVRARSVRWIEAHAERRPGSILANPLFQAAIRFSSAGAMEMRAVLICFSAVLGFLPVFGAPLVLLLLAIAIPSFTRGLASEQEHGRVDLLRGTLLTHWDIAFAPLIVALYVSMPVILGAELGQIVGSVFHLDPDPNAPTARFRSPFTVLGTHVAFVLSAPPLVFFFAGVAAFATTAATTRARAIGTSLVIATLWLIFAPAFGGFTRALSPFIVFFEIASGSTKALFETWVPYAALHAAAGGVFLALAISVAESAGFADARGKRPRSDGSAVVARRRG